jgi:hypothetical protein
MNEWSTYLFVDVGVEFEGQASVCSFDFLLRSCGRHSQSLIQRLLGCSTHANPIPLLILIIIFYSPCPAERLPQPLATNPPRNNYYSSSYSPSIQTLLVPTPMHATTPHPQNFPCQECHPCLPARSDLRPPRMHCDQNCTLGEIPIPNAPELWVGVMSGGM